MFVYAKITPTHVIPFTVEQKWKENEKKNMKYTLCH